jgi:hypothetical protein
LAATSPQCHGKFGLLLGIDVDNGSIGVDHFPSNDVLSCR